jgi:pimeloyl-ACP methyl ester carboxylesterase
MERRNFFSGAIALGALGTVGGAVAQSQTKRSFVLVHGAWHGGWCWVRVADRLRAAGHAVFTPTLTGLGERSHLLSPQVTLDTHITDVVNVIEYEELHQVVLVGHSYAGTIISGVADRIAPRLSRLVYLDSQILEPGNSLFDLLGKETAEKRLKVIKETGGGVGAAALPPALFGVKDPADVAWVLRRMTLQPVGTYSHTFTLKAPIGNGVSKTYIDCTVDPIPNLEPMKKRARTEPGWSVRTLATGHDAMITAPGPLAEMLIDIAG